MLRKWDELPEFMKTEDVRPYYEYLKKKRVSLLLKRGFDFIVALVMLVVLFPILLVIAIFITVDSKGGIFYSQERITQYGRKFKILKFRTMVANADKIGAQITMLNDMRVTKIGKILRRYRLDELPQLINVILGDMSFVGTRPESPVYVRYYTKEMFATLLLPAGITSEASIQYKDEAEMLENTENVDKVYINEVLPGKMKYNLNSVRQFTGWRDLATMIKTVFKVMGK